MGIGADRVRLGFNPASDNAVDKIKLLSAELIDICSTVRAKGAGGGDPELERLRSLAMTAYEEAAMWAVKAATYGK